LIGLIGYQAGRRDYTVKVYPNGSHNLLEVPSDNTDEYVRLKRFPPGLFETMVDWTTTQASSAWGGKAVDRSSIIRRLPPASCRLPFPKHFCLMRVI
jgi:hypothetical protein